MGSCRTCLELFLVFSPSGGLPQQCLSLLVSGNLWLVLSLESVESTESGSKESSVSSHILGSRLHRMTKRVECSGMRRAEESISGCSEWIDSLKGHKERFDWSSEIVQDQALLEAHSCLRDSEGCGKKESSVCEVYPIVRRASSSQCRNPFHSVHLHCSPWLARRAGRRLNSLISIEHVAQSVTN